MIIRRLLIISLIGIVTSFSLLAYLIAGKEAALLEQTTENTALFFATSVTTALKNAMLEGMPEIAKNTVYDLNRQQSIGVSIYRSDGTLAFGEGNLLIPGKLLEKPQKTRLNVNNNMYFITPMSNENSCMQCHSADKKTLGIVAIRMPLAATLGNVRETERRLLFFGILLVFSASAAVFLVSKKMMLDPLMRVHKGVESFKGGNLSHRIALEKKDEIGALAGAFNEMAEQIEKSHIHMEKAITEKTRELRVIADLSLEVFKGGINLESIIDQFLCAITDQMGYGYSALCLVDKETGLLSTEFRKGIGHGFCTSGLSLASDHPFSKTVREARPSIRKCSDIGTPETFEHIVIIPILSHQRKRCSFVNRCTLEGCPAFHSADERCWLIENTLCRSPKAVAGKEKIFGCVHCEAFPVMGVLIAARNEEISKSSLHSMEILASEITSAVENQRFIESKKEDIESLIRLHDISIESLQGTGSALTQSIVSSTTLFSDIDASILWLMGDDGKLHFADSFNLEKDSIPDSLSVYDSFAGLAITNDRVIETAELDEAGCLSNVIHQIQEQFSRMPYALQEKGFLNDGLRKTGNAGLCKPGRFSTQLRRTIHFP
jgi:HAMP domain-containing protein